MSAVEPPNGSVVAVVFAAVTAFFVHPPNVTSNCSEYVSRLYLANNSGRFVVLDWVAWLPLPDLSFMRPTYWRTPFPGALTGVVPALSVNSVL
jgi:hypothetical protein